MVGGRFGKGAYLAVLMVDHNVMRLHVAVHDAFAVAVVEGLEQLKDVVADVDVVELGVQAAEVGVVDVLEDERGRLALRVADDVEEGDDVGAAGEVLQDLDLALDLLLLDGLEDLDDAFLVVDDVDAFEHFGVFSSAWFGEWSVGGASSLAGGEGEWEGRTDLADDLVVFEDSPACDGRRHVSVCFCDGTGGMGGWCLGRGSLMLTLS